MALQSEVSPPLVGDPNKDTKNDGDTKSDENETSSSTEEDVDLEEGEILDSEAEEEEKKDLTKSSLQEAVDKNILQSIEQLVNQAKNEANVSNAGPQHMPPHHSPIKMHKRSKYMDHDHYESGSDQEDGWYPKKHKPKFDSKPLDYRNELDAYIGTPPSSPERKHRDDKKKKKSSKKPKKSGKKTIRRKDIKGERVRAIIKESMRKKMCKFFKEGKCAKGSDCNFSHALPYSHKKKELCKFYLSGHCNKGNDCSFMHQEFPCKFYHTGAECYAKDNCRFSHAPLSEEMKRVLADYLRMHHGDDDYERKRRRSPSPEKHRPPQKRTCLLGSPPRHIREAEETKRWQEEMQQLPHPGFKINLNEDDAPPVFHKPNFYQETLPDSPCKPRNKPDHKFRPFGPRDIDDRFSVPTSKDIFVYEEDYQDDDVPDLALVKHEPEEQHHWENIHHSPTDVPPPLIKTEMKPYISPNRQDLDFTRDVKFDETTQFSEMESSIDGHSVSSPRMAMHPGSSRESEEEMSNQEPIKTEPPSDESTLVQEPPPVPIIVPSHLPKKAQELFKRIQKQEMKHSVTVPDPSSSPKYDCAETHVKDEPEESLGDSSDDDDDDDIAPLTNVLKNLQKAPPPVKQELKPAQNLMAMLNKIQQKAMEKKGTADQQPPNFLQSLLGTITAPRETAKPTSLSLPTSQPSRRTLLPDPIAMPPVVQKEPAVAPMDPRLKSRDPRSAPKPPVVPLAPTLPSLKPPALPTTVTEPVKEEIPYKLHGIVTTGPNYASYISASQNNPSLLKDPRLRKHMSLSQKKINGVENSKDVEAPKAPAKNAPPIPKLLLKYDFSESINIFEPSKPAALLSDTSEKETQSAMPKLSDPRMRRRESQNSSGSDTPPHLTIADNAALPPSSQISLAAAPILEREVPKPSEEKKWLPPVLEKSWTPPVLEQGWQQLVDKDDDSWQQPVIKKEDESWPESAVKKEADSPPRDQSWMPQVSNEQSWTQPSFKQEDDSEDDSDALKLEIDEGPSGAEKEDSPIKKQEKPTPASHLPRAIADPRMAKLQNPVSLARTQKAAPQPSIKASEPKSSPDPENPPPDPPEETPTPAEPVPKITLSIPKKKRGATKNEEKQKTVRRNRKTSMDYASPLDSCNSTQENLTYNRYNQRPRRACTMKNTKVSITAPVTNSVGDSTPDFTSDNSNLDSENSSDVNLKDKFKTIDPTASPFC